MFDLLKTVYEYQCLAAREEALDEETQARLFGLETLLRGAYAGGESTRERARRADPLPVQFTIPGGFARGKMHSLSRRGVAVVGTKGVATGTRTVLRVADPVRGIEYTFPGTVVWHRGKVIGIAFDGVPSTNRFLSPSTAPWRRFWFSRYSEPLVA
jgi:hypothetical protein